MTNHSPVNPMKSKLGREIYALALLLASAPILLIGTISLSKIEAGYRESAEENLANSAKAYGELIYERLLTAREVANHIVANAGTSLLGAEIPPHFSGYIVVSTNHDELVRTSEFEYATDDIESLLDSSGLSVVKADEGNSLVLTHGVEGRTFIGIFDTNHLWGDSSDFPYAIDFCVLAVNSVQPLFCSAQIPPEIVQLTIESTNTRGRFEWGKGEKGYIGTYWELFTDSSVGGPSLRIIASQPQSIALAAVNSFRDVYAPGLLVTIVFTLLASGFYARRALVPLAQLLELAKKYAKRNFDANVDFRRDDEFRDVAVALKGMADDLNREFKTREALAEIDELILANTDRDEVCQTVLERARECTRFDSLELVLFQNDADNLVYRSTPSDGTNTFCASGSKTVITDNNGRTEMPPGIETETHDHEPQLASDQTYIALVAVNNLIVGEMIGAWECDTPDALCKEHLRQFADRVAIGLEYSQKSEELQRRAYFDELTGLPNRESCLLRIDQAIDLAKRNNHRVALMFVDLDGFKGVNDSLGHVVGDELIQQAANRLTECVGHYGFTARLGGDEFAVLVPFSNDDQVYQNIADRIIKVLRRPFTVAGAEALLGASIGTAQFPKDGENHVELLRKADAAMYRAKASGRSQHADYSQTMGMRIDAQLRLETELSHALERDELFLVFQPQVDLRNSQAHAAEALLRWRHSEDGLISPAEFIPIAEQSGQIIQIGNWALYNACAQLREWQGSGLDIRRMAVNVSARQVNDERFICQVKDCIREFDIKPGELELELTESLLVERQQMSAALAHYKQLGVCISIDDFGTGYSSLSYLRTLDFDVVKIDRSFVTALPSDNDAAAIVHAVVAMCHTLGKSVVAEGITTEAQLAFLSNARVDVGQGYFLGKPMAPDDFRHWSNARAASTHGFARTANT